MLGSERMRAKIRAYVAIWKTRGYPEGIPDEADPVLEMLGKVPSFRMICRAIMKNDVALLTLGYGRQPCETYMVLKRQELAARGQPLWPHSPQLELFPQGSRDGVSRHVATRPSRREGYAQLREPL